MTTSIPILTQDALKRLINEQDEFCVSLYMPVYLSAPGDHQNETRLKNLLREAAHLLQDKGCDPDAAAKLLKPLHELKLAPEGGLAVFVSGLALRIYHLPLQPPELVMVGSRFYIRPLLPLLSGDGCFYVLALSQQDTLLLQCTRYSTQIVPLPPLPHPAEDIHPKDAGMHLAARSAGSVGAGREAVRFYGQGSIENVTKDILLDYCRAVHQAIHHILHDEHAPLVLAGGPVLLALFREVNRYPYIRHEAIETNPDTLTLDELRQRAWDLVSPVFKLSERIARERYQQFSGTRRVSTNLRSIVHAALEGHVETLFVPQDGQAWGKVDPETGTIAVNDERLPSSDDLLDLAAAYTLAHNGTVYTEDGAGMPDGESLTALLRY